jgi:hypothetical protein
MRREPVNIDKMLSPKSPKSPGLIWYEHEEASLLDQYRTGKIDCRQFFTSVMAALRRASWAMNETERREFQRNLFLVVHTITYLFAKFGHPVPGNDPLRPN